MRSLSIFPGEGMDFFVQNICDSLKIEPGRINRRRFSDGELWVKFEDNIRGQDVFLIQSTNQPDRNLKCLLMMIDAARRSSAKRITAVIPYYGYARQERKDQPRVPITAALDARIIEFAGASRILTLDLHANPIEGFFWIPVDHLYARPVILKRLEYLKDEDLVFVAPDSGAMARAESYAERLGKIVRPDGSTRQFRCVKIEKRRPKPNEATIWDIMGEIKNGQTAIIVDDLIDTGRTLVNAAKAIKDRGAKEVIAVAAHGVLSGKAFDNLASDVVSRVFVTDTIPRTDELPGKFEIISVAPLFAEAIKRIHLDESLSDLIEGNFNF